MRVNLSPQRSDRVLEASRSGSALIVNGETFDFSQMNDGDTLPASAISGGWFVDQVSKVGGELELTLLLPLPANFSPAQAFPVPLLNVPDGTVVLPQPLPITEAVAEQEPDA